MGVWNVEQAGLLAAQLQLEHRAARLLLWMANKALDEPGREGEPPRRYFAAREHLAIGIGYLAPDSGGPTAQRKVRAALQELVAAGAISYEDDGNTPAGARGSNGGAYAGSRAVYVLNLPAKPSSRAGLAVVTGGRRKADRHPPPTYPQGGAWPASFRAAEGGG